MGLAVDSRRPTVANSPRRETIFSTNVLTDDVFATLPAATRPRANSAPKTRKGGCRAALRKTKCIANEKVCSTNEEMRPAVQTGKEGSRSYSSTWKRMESIRNSKEGSPRLSRNAEDAMVHFLAVHPHPARSSVRNLI